MGAWPRTKAKRQVAPLLDSSPLFEQTLADVEVFLRQVVAENLTLDYKRELGDSAPETWRS